MKYISYVTVLLLALMQLACQKEQETVTLNRSFAQIEMDSTLMLTATANGGEIVWTSSDENIATVFHGAVTPVSAGKVMITASCGKGSASCVVVITYKGGTYYGEPQLVWADEFNGTQLDTSYWNVEVNGNGGGNNELQYYTDRPENLRVSDGCLVIEARKETYESRNYTSARITTKNKKDFCYGKLEARISFPEGRGTWPAFWMLGYGSWPTCGEIDIVEHIGSNPTMTSFALHTRQANGSKGNNWNARTYAEETMENEFHTYGIEWRKDYEYSRDFIVFYVDGKQAAFSTESKAEPDFETWPFNKSFYVIFNLAIGGNMGGSVNNDIFADQANNPVLMKVDWVRAYQYEYLQ